MKNTLTSKLAGLAAAIATLVVVVGCDNSRELSRDATAPNETTVSTNLDQYRYGTNTAATNTGARYGTNSTATNTGAIPAR